jgi:hypothetical protein
MTIFYHGCAMCRSRQVTILELVGCWTSISPGGAPHDPVIVGRFTLDIDFTFLDVEYHPRTEPTTILAYLL